MCRKADKLSASTLVGQLGVSCSFDWLIKVNKNLWAFLSNVPCIKVIWFGIFLWPLEKIQIRIILPISPPLRLSICVGWNDICTDISFWFFRYFSEFLCECYQACDRTHLYSLFETNKRVNIRKFNPKANMFLPKQK